MREETEFLAEACEVLAGNRRSLPFTMVYLFEDDRASLACSSGIDEGHVAAPAVIGLDDRDAVWPVREPWSGRAALVPLTGRRFGDLPTGDWDEPPERALLLPILQPAHERPFGFLIAGLNRYSLFDTDYRAFIELVAQHLSANRHAGFV